MWRFMILVLFGALVVGCAEAVVPSAATTPTPAASPASPAAPLQSPRQSPTPVPSASARPYAMYFEPGILDVGTVQVGSARAMEVRLRSPGSMQVSELTLAIDPPMPGGFSIADSGQPCTDGTIDGAEDCGITLRFTPSGIGAAPAQTLLASGITTDGRPASGGLALAGAGTSWARRPVPEYTTAGGADVAVTTDGTTRYAHVVVSNLEEAWVNGDDASVYLRTRTDGRTWNQRLMVGGYDPRIAAGGRYVYLVFEAYRCGEGVGLMRNSDHGRRGAWSAVTCLTRTSNYMGSPAIAAAGGLVYVASSNDATGRVEVHVSRDRGRTWSRTKLGAAVDREGSPGGQPIVVAAGRLAAIAWENGGATYVRVSKDGGRHWAKPIKLADGWPKSASARGTRLAFTGIAGSCDESDAGGTAWGRLWDDSGSPVAVPITQTVRSCYVAWDARLVVGPDASLGVVSYTDANGCRTEWKTSRDGGASWSPPEPLPGCVSEPSSIVWGSDGALVLLAGGGDDDDDLYYSLIVREPDR